MTIIKNGNDMHTVPKLLVTVKEPYIMVHKEGSKECEYLPQEVFTKAIGLVNQLVAAGKTKVPYSILLRAAYRFQVWDLDKLQYYYEGTWPDLEQYGRDLYPDTNPELAWFVDWETVAKAALDDKTIFFSDMWGIHIFNPYKEEK